MFLADWLARLETYHPAEIELGLPRIAAVAERLGCDHPTCPVITVAGTNGKGSVVSVLEALALDAGLRVGSYTSPHILRYNERVRLDGEPVSDEALIASFEQVDAARGDTPLTYFEFGTLGALQVFRDENLDLLVLEVGLGGRLDAVNIIDPTVAVITRVDLDHESWLGDNREQIGTEKAGILRPGIPVVLGDPVPPRSVLDAANGLGCEIHRIDAAERALFEDCQLLPENIAAAWRAARCLGLELPPGRLRPLVQNLGVPARQQSFQLDGRTVVLDVAHNPAAVARLAEHLRNIEQAPARAVFSALSDKDIHAMIAAGCGGFDGWHPAGLPGVTRGVAAAELAALLEEQGEPVKSVSQDPLEAFDRALRDARPGQCIAAFGSFHVAGALLDTLEARSRS